MYIMANVNNNIIYITTYTLRIDNVIYLKLTFFLCKFCTGMLPTTPAKPLSNDCWNNNSSSLSSRALGPSKASSTIDPSDKATRPRLSFLPVTQNNNISYT